MFNLADTDSIVSQLEEDVQRLGLATVQLMVDFEGRCSYELIRSMQSVESRTRDLSSSLECRLQSVPSGCL